MKLKKLIHIDNGAAFRKGIESLPEGDVGIIQLKDLSYEGTVDLSGVSRISAGVLKGQCIASQEDVLIRTRGANFKAAKLGPHQGQWAVASPISILRVLNHQILPEYLLWFLNLPRTQGFLRSMAEGTSLKQLKKAALEELEVPIPPLEQQRCFADLAALHATERRIADELEMKREQLLEGILMQAASRL